MSKNTKDETPCYVAVTSEQHPLTGEAMPVLKKVTRETTVGELIDWYKQQQHGSGILYDLRITEAI